MAQELIFSAQKYENMRHWRNGAAWLEHWVSLPNHIFPTSVCAYSFAWNWQLPFLNQQKGFQQYLSFTYIHHDLIITLFLGSKA